MLGRIPLLVCPETVLRWYRDVLGTPPRGQVSPRTPGPSAHRPALAGFLRSTSFLPPSVLGDHGAAFDADLTAALGAFAKDGAFPETVSFAYDLARKPGP